MPVIFRDKEVLDKIRPRIDKDVYETPGPLVAKTIEWLFRNCKVRRLQNSNVLDPGAGAGVWGHHVREMFSRVNIIGVELRRIRRSADYHFWYNENFISMKSSWHPGLVIGNPPFLYAQEFILKAQSMLADRGLICFLLPTQFQHTQTRARGLFTEYRPEWIVALAQRPNFTGPHGVSLGKANTDDYILGVWGKRSAAKTNWDILDWK